jgi:hypothetical protein
MVSAGPTFMLTLMPPDIVHDFCINRFNLLGSWTRTRSCCPLTRISRHRSMGGPSQQQSPRPARGSTSGCPRRPPSTIAEADQWLGPWLSSESGFIERLLSRLPDTPPNFVKIVEFNERGQLPIGDVTDLEAGANRCAVS